MKKNKVLLIISIMVFAGALGFQIADQNLHMLQSPGAKIDDYEKSDYGLGSNYIEYCPKKGGK